MAEDENVVGADVCEVADDGGDEDDFGPVEAEEEIADGPGGHGEDGAEDEDSAVLTFEDGDLRMFGSVHEVEEGGEGESEWNEDEPADNGKPERVPCVARTAFGVASTEVLADEGVDDGDHSHGESEWCKGVDSAVALCGEFVGSDETDHPCVDELHDGVGSHREDGGPGDGPEFAERGDMCAWERLRIDGGVHARKGIIIVRR